MKHTPLLFVAVLLTLAGCQRDETVAAYGGEDKVWRLTDIDGDAFLARATLTFPKPGEIAGDAPCNSFAAPMSAPYPWFETGPIRTTRQICPEMEAELLYLATLSQMTLVEVLGNILILSTPQGRSAVFKADG